MSRWSAHSRWSRRQWIALRWVLVVVAAVDLTAAALFGLGWVGLVAVLLGSLGAGLTFWGERMEHGARRRGGELR